MKQNIYSVFDKSAKVFSPSFNAQNNAVALRMFDSACKDANTMVARYPADFELYLLAEWDDNSGEYKNITPIQRLVTGADMFPAKKEPSDGKK